MPNLTLGNVTIDRDRFEVWVDRRRVDLTFVEFELLWELARNAPRVITRQQLMRSVWREPQSNASAKINIQICRLRKKLRDSNPWTIETHSKRGYALTTFEPEAGGLGVPATAQPLAVMAFAFGPGHHVTALATLAAACVGAVLVAKPVLHAGRSRALEVARSALGALSLATRPLRRRPARSLPGARRCAEPSRAACVTPR